MEKIKAFFAKVKAFVKKWWRVAACAFMIIMLGFAAGCSISVAETHNFVGVVGIVGTFTAICVCVAVMLTEIFDNIPPKGKKR